MAEVPRLLAKLARQLFPDRPEERDAFAAALLNPRPTGASLLWRDDRPEPPLFSALPPLPWQPPWVDRLDGDRLDPDARPGKHPAHEAGAFYCLDFSSVFAASVLLAIAEPVRVAIDLCAAPGGKSAFLWRAFRPELLVANETIGKRAAALRSNLKRCRIAPAAVTGADPARLAERWPATADLVLADAPCSGQSLLAKGDRNPGCFHPVNVNKNANRQKRILANAAALVAPGGYLAYTTCTYAPEENEKVCAWLGDRFPAFQPVAAPALAEFQSPLTDRPSYRLFPQAGLGAGAFAMLWQRREAGDRQPFPAEFPALARFSPEDFA